MKTINVNSKGLLSAALVALFLIIYSGTACGKGPAKAEALKAIRKNQGYPKMEAITLQFIKKGSPVGEEIDRLVNDGWLIRQTDKHNNEVFIITEKCSPLIKDVSYSIGFKYMITLEAFKKDVSHIKEILVDSRKGVAVVEYAIKYEPTDIWRRFEKLENLEYYAGGYLFDYRKQVTRKAYFREWDKGWRIVDSF